jgi:hypothetical protein
VIKVYLNNFDFKNDLQIKKNAQECGIIVNGHSGLGIKGSDIVCSAVSAIIQTAVASITRVAEIHQDIVQKEGYLESKIDLSDLNQTNINALKIIIHTMIIGLKLIDENYPKTLKIIIE